MNYFELYGIPVSLRVDAVGVRQHFLELSRKYHPDFYTQAPEEKQALMLENSSLVNKAYKVFQNQDETIRYVLRLKNLLEEEEKYNLEPEFLMEVMEVNEQLMELAPAENGELLQAVEQQADALLDQIYGEVADIITSYKEGITTEHELLQVKAYYYKKKYLQRILDKIAQLRNIASP